MDFKEFLIAVAVGCFLKADPSQENAYFLRIRKGFEAVQLAFGKIDKDGSGEIDFVELKEAFLAMKEDELVEERLKELDFNGDKNIEFPEFVWGLCAWVGMDEGDDDEMGLDDEPETSFFIVDHEEAAVLKEKEPELNEDLQEEKEEKKAAKPALQVTFSQ